MFKLAYTAPENATGKIKELYDIFPPQIGVPLPMQLLSASPDMLAQRMDVIKYYMNHPELDFPILAAIRLIASTELCFDFCVNLNAGMLQRVGMTGEQVASLLGDMADVPFDAKEVALLKLIQKVVRDPKTVSDADVAACREAGWSDAAILDASGQAASMAVPARLMAAFVK
ncbi:MAG: carboxymuconolactone decarboxylase family protein [Desulfovibrionaceae bacterium]